MTRSRIEGGGTHDGEVPMGGIKVSQGLVVCVEERDDRSQKSDASMKNLTASSSLEETKWEHKETWTECRSVCATPTAQSRSASRNHGTDTAGS